MSGEAPLRLCSLELALGKTESCPGEGCPFWEPGGAVLDGRCAVERFGLTPQGSLLRWLLEIRERLASANGDEEAHAALSRLHHLLNESAE